MSTQQVQPRLLDIGQCAEYLSMSGKIIRRLILESQLPFIQRVRGRSRYLIDIKDLDKWIEASKIRPLTT